LNHPYQRQTVKTPTVTRGTLTDSNPFIWIVNFRLLLMSQNGPRSWRVLLGRRLRRAICNTSNGRSNPHSRQGLRRYKQVLPRANKLPSSNHDRPADRRCGHRLYRHQYRYHSSYSSSSKASHHLSGHQDRRSQPRCLLTRRVSNLHTPEGTVKLRSSKTPLLVLRPSRTTNILQICDPRAQTTGSRWPIFRN
jgi:hypothetical protein